MHTRLFLTTFALIFLAELGDKTQLAAMARSAAAGTGKWTIFLAASAALVVSTLIAVLLGSALTRVVPEGAVKLGAGVLFVLFGILIIRGVFVPGRAAVPPAEPGMLGRAVLRLAASFEEAAVEDYGKLAARAGEPELRSVLQSLADEEAEHLRRVRSAGARHADVRLELVSTDILPSRASLSHNAAEKGESVLDHAIRHEQATANFYGELARLTPVPSLKQVLAALSAEEREHAERLALLRDGNPADGRRSRWGPREGVARSRFRLR
jgi:rubrerythrin